jgi:HPt (histidine-containing phosphotransfer) domain-containing protein
MAQQRDHSQRAAVNLPELLTRMENDRDLLCELIGLFKEGFPPLLHQLRQYVASEDMKNVEGTSHSLKGILSGLSVTRAAAVASRLEQMARANDRAGLADVLLLFEYEVAGLSSELDSYAEKVRP